MRKPLILAVDDVPGLPAQEILRNAGTRFDPKITAAFKKALPAMRKVRAAIGDELGEIINLDFSQTAASAPAAKNPPVTLAAKK